MSGRVIGLMVVVTSLVLAIVFALTRPPGDPPCRSLSGSRVHSWLTCWECDRQLGTLVDDVTAADARLLEEVVVDFPSWLEECRASGLRARSANLPAGTGLPDSIYLKNYVSLAQRRAVIALDSLGRTDFLQSLLATADSGMLSPEVRDEIHDILGLTPAPATGSIATITVSPSQSIISEGNAVMLLATPRTSDGSFVDTVVTWSSSDAASVTVTPLSRTRARAIGASASVARATIRAQVGAVSGTATVSVERPIDPRDTLVVVRQPSRPITAGDTVSLAVAIRQSGRPRSEQVVTWEIQRGAGAMFSDSLTRKETRTGSAGVAWVTLRAGPSPQFIRVAARLGRASGNPMVLFRVRAQDRP